MTVEAVPQPTDGSGMIELVVTDLDGTLWDHAGIMHPRTRHALQVLDARGVRVLAATARRLPSAVEMMRAAEICLPVIALDGGLGVDEGGSMFHQSVFDPEDARLALKLLREADLEPCINVVCPSDTVLVGAAPATHAGHLAEIAPWTRRADLNAALDEHQVMSLLVCGCDHTRAVTASQALERLTGTTVSVSRDLAYGQFGLSARPAGTTKWSGVTAYCRHAQLRSDRVLAIGDGENDLPMLEAATVSCAPADASPSILDCVDHIIGPTSSGGWADILNLL